jgi:predicted porin
VAANFTPKVSAVLQVDSEYHTGNTYQPEVEFANVKYAFIPNAYIRVGRITLPTFLNSENRDIGYTYAWIHPPLEVYRQEPITHSDGVDVMYRLQMGEVGNSIKAIYGSTTIDTNDRSTTSKLSSRDLWGIFDTVEYGPTTIHVGYQERETDSQTGETEARIRESDLSVGVNYDPGDWFAMSEWIQRKSTTKISAMYVSAGYRVKKFTPYLTYSQNSPGSFLPGFPTPSSDDLRLANRSQSTVSLGVRWDFMKNTDLKLQYDQVKLSDNSTGYRATVPANVIL